MSGFKPRGTFVPVSGHFEEVIYGVPMCGLGEDGDEYLLLGHVAPRKAIAVVMAYGRRVAGLAPDEALGQWGGGWTVEDALKNVTHGHAIFTHHSDYCDDLQLQTAEQLAEDGYLDEGEPKREVCACDEYGWWATWVRDDADSAGAIAVTRYEL